ncbi:hypothetical protein BY458DRAFT_583613 [Sporodiniella umbellata]|nr:hypothetical protein BY458DRAFT_583613 [Sporodiniella umbellata]
MFLFEGNESSSSSSSHKVGRSSSKGKKNKGKDAEAKAVAKAKKIQQDDMESLQITFYEIESWIEKTSPVLSKLTKELDRVSKHFSKTKEKKPKEPEIDLSSMQWTLTFQPNNSMRLETNIKRVEQLIEAVQKIQLVTGTSSVDNTAPAEEEELDISSSASLSSSTSTTITEHSIEYWKLAMLKRPSPSVEQYQDCMAELSKLSEQVTPDQLSFLCESYWQCLFPKFSSDWSTFWHRSEHPQRNRVCVDSSLAMVFTHIIRHDKSACPNAQVIAYYYYERTRQSLADYFDSPDEAIVEAVLNTSMYNMVWKRYSAARLYLELAYRMLVQLGYHRQSGLPTLSAAKRKRCIRLFLVLYYVDMCLSTYSSDPFLIDDTVHDIDFHALLPNDEQQQDTFFVHLLELMKLHKRIQTLAHEFHEYSLQHPHTGTLLPRWTKRIQRMEIILASWLDRVPSDYKSTEMNNTKTRPALLLMLSYQMQWIALHKIFLSPTHIPSSQTSYSPHRSYSICFDAANRIVLMAERIVHQFDWCVCQLFPSCVYQASTIFYKSMLSRDVHAKYSKGMIRRIISILDSRSRIYGGLPDDLVECLCEFLEDNKLQTMDANADDYTPSTIIVTDAFFNSPKKLEQCIKQEIIK